jgi:3-oxoacyl-[acyl-carrier protein] reductase
MKILEGRSAMVTGASRGIGRAICLKLAAAGANVAGMDIDPQPMLETAGEVRKLGVQCLELGGDVSIFQQMASAVEQTVKEFGALDIMVNNAGITRDNLLIRMSDDDWQKVISINLTGVFNGVKSAARAMLRQKRGSIVNIASVVGIMGNAGQANYSASKAGVIGLTKSAARELAKKGVRVNAVAPGYIVTRMTEQLSEEARTSLQQQIPMQRLGMPEDVADAVLFLASDASAYITGHVLSVDGGMAM